MNFTMTLTCNLCNIDIDCRIGMSNRNVQPLSFACPECENLIKITVTINGTRTPDFTIVGAVRKVERQPSGFFEGKNPFVDLHLDFPVWSTSYVPGMSPFMVAAQMIQRYGGDDSSTEQVMFHGSRMDYLNSLAESKDHIRRLINLYLGKNKQLFKLRVSQFLDKDLGKSLAPQDVNAALYLFLSTVFRPFVQPEEVRSLVKGFTGLTYKLHTEHGVGFDNFVGHIIDTKFIFELQKDCLELYPEIFGAELPLRPALFLDLLPSYRNGKIAARISTSEFRAYKDLYKDIIEVFGRQLVIVAGINNIFHRNNHDAFAKPKDGSSLSSLDKFADKTISEKFKYLDDCWYIFESGIIDTDVRNSIAHFKAEYDEVSQLITYYPKKEGVRQDASEQMYFLDFMRMLLVVFREVHYLHHVIKALFYYEYLIRSKQA